MPLFAASSIPSTLQGLTPEQARFCLGLARFINNDLGVDVYGKRLLVGFSGGADSTALLLALRALSQKLNTCIVAAHVNHGLRAIAGEEARQCREFCDALGIAFVECERDITAASRESRCGTEETARNVRYEFFEESACTHECDWILTAHNANDLAEDILMRLIRGAGWPALSGMDALDANRKLIRPLLQTSRRMIEAFLDGLGVSWINDESNADVRYFRNRVRHKILPMILEENPSFLEAARGLWKLGRIDASWVNAELEKSAPEGSFISSQKLKALPKALRMRLYKQMLARLGPGQARLDSLLALDASWIEATGEGKSALNNGHGTGEEKVHCFIGGKKAWVSRKGIYWACGPKKT